MRISRLSLAAAVTLVLVACTSEPTRTPSRTGPSAISSTSGSPLADCTADASSARPGTENAGAEVEPSLAVDPTDPDRMAVAWQQDRWFDGAARGIVVATTSDAGATWEESGETRLSLCTGGTPGTGTAFTRVTDPWLSFAPEGDLHLVGLAVDLDPDASVGANPEAVVVTSSTNGGSTWSNPTPLVRDADPNVYNDKPSVTADPNDARFVYAVWHRLTDAKGHSVTGDTRFARSTDGGSTWETTQRIHGPTRDGQSLGNEVVVLPRNDRFGGELVNIFSLIEYRGGRERVSVAAMSSHDHGKTWSEPVRIAELQAAPVRLPGRRLQLKTGHLLPRVAVDPVGGMLYVVWSEGSFGTERFNDVALSMSDDGGRSWSVPVKVNTTPELTDAATRQTFTPEVAVTSRGELAISYFDFRNSADAETGVPTDLFVVRCREPAPDDDGCSESWSERRLTPSSFDLTLAPDSGGPFLGDYIGLTGAGPNVVVAFPQPGKRGDAASIYFGSFPPTTGES